MVVTYKVHIYDEPLVLITPLPSKKRIHELNFPHVAAVAFYRHGNPQRLCAKYVEIALM